MNKKNILLLIILIIVSVTIAGCGIQAPSASNKTTPPTSAVPEINGTPSIGVCDESKKYACSSGQPDILADGFSEQQNRETGQMGGIVDGEPQSRVECVQYYVHRWTCSGSNVCEKTYTNINWLLKIIPITGANYQVLYDGPCK